MTETQKNTLVGRHLTLTWSGERIPTIEAVTWNKDGFTVSPGSMLYDGDVCAEVAALLRRACWVWLHADRPLWYAPALIRSGLYDHDLKLKKRRDAAARE